MENDFCQQLRQHLSAFEQALASGDQELVTSTFAKLESFRTREIKVPEFEERVQVLDYLIMQRFWEGYEEVYEKKLTPEERGKFAKVKEGRVITANFNGIVYHITHSFLKLRQLPSGLHTQTRDSKRIIARKKKQMKQAIRRAEFLTGLEELNAYKSDLTEFDFQYLIRLKKLDLYENFKMTRLNLTGLKRLQTLLIGDCWNLRELELSLDKLVTVYLSHTRVPYEKISWIIKNAQRLKKIECFWIDTLTDQQKRDLKAQAEEKGIEIEIEDVENDQ